MRYGKTIIYRQRKGVHVGVIPEHVKFEPHELKNRVVGVGGGGMLSEYLNETNNIIIVYEIICFMNILCFT